MSETDRQQCVPMPLIDCPDCRREISDAAPTCIHCGRPMGLSARTATAVTSPAAAPTSAVSAARESTPRGLACSRCGSDDVRRLSIIHSGGLTHVATETVGIMATGRQIGVGAAATAGSHTTDLALLAAPPPPESRRSPAARAVFGCVFVIAAAESYFGGSAWYGTTFLIVGLVSFVLARDARQFNTTWDYPQRLARWERSFMCLRCGNVFDPAG